MKSKIYILLAIGILMLSAADVNAQVKAGSFSISPMAGYSWFAKMNFYNDTETYGIALGYNFSERFGIEATYNILDTEVKPEGITHIEADPNVPPGPQGGAVTGTTVVDVAGGTAVDAYQYALEAIFYIYPGKKFAPYGVIGVGRSRFEYEGADGTESVSETNLPAGFGCKYYITDKIALRADLRSVVPVDDNNLRATIGVTFQLGGK